MSHPERPATVRDAGCTVCSHSNALGPAPINAAFAGEDAKHTAPVPQSIEPPGSTRSAKSDACGSGGSLAMLAMNRVLKSGAQLGLVVLIAFGCSKAPLSPAQLTQQIAAADRVVLTNYPSSSVEFIGTEAQNLVRAVSESKGEKLPKNTSLSCPAGVYLQFYRGTNLLAQVHGHDGHFVIDDVSFSDSSGALQAAWKRVYETRQKR